MFKNKKQKKIINRIIVLFFIFFLPLTGFGCRGASQEVKKSLHPVSLEIWGTYLSRDEIQPLLKKYKSLHPYVSINYKQIPSDIYEKTLLNALAEDRGPDVFMVPNKKVYEYRNKIVSAPDMIKLPKVTVSGGLKKETKIVMDERRGIGVNDLKKAFVSVVADDVVLKDPVSGKEGIYALPLDMDTLVLYYNTDLLDKANIAEAPKTWEEVQKIVPALTRFDDEGNVEQSAINLGLAENISNYFDILSILMMQNGTIMVGKDDRRIHFHEMPSALRGKVSDFPGINALEFYTSFAKKEKANYTWSDQIKNDLDAFASGKLAMFVGYKYHGDIIKSLAPKLHYAVSALPQVSLEYPTNYANYWVLAVAKKTKEPMVAWDLVEALASKEYVEPYLKKYKKITVLRSLINEEKKDEELAVYVDQILSARNWYHGANYDLAEKEIANLIDITVSGQYKKLRNILEHSAYKIDDTYNK